MDADGRTSCGRSGAAAPGAPILVHANAGMPKNVDGADVFPETPAVMAGKVAGRGRGGRQHRRRLLRHDAGAHRGDRGAVEAIEGGMRRTERPGGRDRAWTKKFIIDRREHPLHADLQGRRQVRRKPLPDGGDAIVYTAGKADALPAGAGRRSRKSADWEAGQGQALRRGDLAGHATATRRARPPAWTTCRPWRASRRRRAPLTSTSTWTSSAPTSPSACRPMKWTAEVVQKAPRDPAEHRLVQPGRSCGPGSRPATRRGAGRW